MIRINANRIPFLILVALASAIQPVAGQDAAGRSLKWKLTKGDQFEVTLVQASKTRTKVDSRETAIHSETTLVFDWNVLGVEGEVEGNGDATIEQSLASVKLSVGDPAAPDQVVSYDTASEKKPSKVSQELLQQVLPLIGLKFNVVMSPQGEIKDVSIPKETQDQINRLPETLKLRALFSKPGVNEILGAAAIVMPDQELTVGQSWADVSETMTAFGMYNRKRTYTFAGTKTVNGREMAEFTLVASLEPVVADEETQAGNSLKGRLIEFAGSGVLLLDVAGGFFASSNVSNQAESEKPYREKLIQTVVTNQIEMTVSKK